MSSTFKVNGNLLGGKNDIGTFDFETDPFRHGATILPFAAGIYFDRNDYRILWRSDSKKDFIKRFIDALCRLPQCTLYAHNGGRFDFHFLLEYATPQHLKIYGSRVMEMTIGKVTLKDSFPLMPFALEEFKKTKIDYSIFEARERDKPHNRKLITDYLLDDCANLLELITGFREIVGPKDTIGGAAFFQMKKLGIPIEHATEAHDDTFRPYFFGGRVEAFRKGIFDGTYSYFDINSAYPFAMLHEHAHGVDYSVLSGKHGLRLPRPLGQCFVRCIARSKGALPLRIDDELVFPNDDLPREYHVTGWEIAAGLATRTLQIDEILEIWKPERTINFSEFVRTFYARRLNAKREGNEIARLAYKYLLNSGYGKFAQNPREFKEWMLAPFGDNVPGYEWECDFGVMSLWAKNAYSSESWGFYDVATGASITGFVRAMIWRAIVNSREPLYCDTDAIICKSANLPMSEKLGDWKLEGKASRVAIAGKKLYGVKWEKGSGSDRTKVASKGARLTFSDIVSLCKGRTIKWKNEAPTFSLGNIHYIERDINAT